MNMYIPLCKFSPARRAERRSQDDRKINGNGLVLSLPLPAVLSARVSTLFQAQLLDGSNNWFIRWVKWSGIRAGCGKLFWKERCCCFRTLQLFPWMGPDPVPELHRGIKLIIQSVARMAGRQHSKKHSQNTVIT